MKWIQLFGASALILAYIARSSYNDDMALSLCQNTLFPRYQSGKCEEVTPSLCNDVVTLLSNLILVLFPLWKQLCGEVRSIQMIHHYAKPEFFNESKIFKEYLDCIYDQLERNPIVGIESMFTPCISQLERTRQAISNRTKH